MYWHTTLKAVGGSNRNWEKHHIRRVLSEQLEALWKTHPALVDHDRTGDIQAFHARKFDRGGIGFIPLVTEDLGLSCALDITILRPGKAGRIVFKGGDIDNRIKTLLDALRVPKTQDEMKLKSDEANPNPIYCLVEDDELITSLKVSTDQLLVPHTADDSEVCMSMKVFLQGRGGIDTPYVFR